MQDPVSAFGTAAQTKRKGWNLTQKQLAENLHMSTRTLIHTEKGDGTPLFDTVACIAQELDISLDSILFPESNISAIPKCVVDFFSGMSAAEAQIYIDLCRQAGLLKEKK